MHGRVLAHAVHAEVNAPPCDTSAMDGYALRDADLARLPARLTIAAEAFAGSAAPEPLAPGTCVRIFTGGPVPDGADRIVIQENVRREGELAIFEQPPGEARHIRRRGFDFAAGDVLLDAGHAKGRQIQERTALDSIAIPLHPGAARYYREKGMIK